MQEEAVVHVAPEGLELCLAPESAGLRVQAALRIHVRNGFWLSIYNTMII